MHICLSHFYCFVVPAAFSTAPDCLYGLAIETAVGGRLFATQRDTNAVSVFWKQTGKLINVYSNLFTLPYIHVTLSCNEQELYLSQYSGVLSHVAVYDSRTLQLLRFIGSYPELNYPGDSAVDCAEPAIYVTSYWYPFGILVYDPVTGVMKRRFSTVDYPAYLGLDTSRSEIYLISAPPFHIHVYSFDGTFKRSFNNRYCGWLFGEWYRPRDIRFHPGRQLVYVADSDSGLRSVFVPIRGFVIHSSLSQLWNCCIQSGYFGC